MPTVSTRTTPQYTPYADGSPARPSGPRDAEHFRPDIEGLRGIAVLLVVAYHAGLFGVSAGFVGVDVFFVLSGYLITGILVRQFEQSGALDLRGFYARRVLRLLPAATLVLLATLLAEAVLLGPMERIDLSLSAVWTALYSSNVFFMLRATDYFSAGAETNPLLHTWSLAVEEQFYLVWPLLIVASLRVGRSRRALAIVMGACTVASFAASVWLTHARQPWAFFGTPARAWEFGLGGLASLLVIGSTSALRRWGSALGWGGLALVVGGASLLRQGTSFPGIAALLPTLGTMAALVAGAIGTGGAGVLLATPALQWIGKRSYSWYLWHWPVLVLSSTLVRAPTWWARVLWMIGALVLAAATTALVENPIRFNTSLRRRPLRALAMGVACSLGSAAIAFASYRVALADGGALRVAATAKTRLAAGDCIADFAVATPRECVFGDPTSARTVVLIGDSHANEWFPALDAVATQQKWRVVTLVKYSCPVAQVMAYNRVLKRDYTECYAWRAAALQRIAALHPAAVVIGQFARNEVKRRDANGVRDTVTYAEWRDAMHATLATLDSLGTPTVVMRDSPLPGSNVPTCLSRAMHAGTPTTACGRARDRALDAATFQAEHDAAVGLAHVSFVDLSNEICTATRCDPERDGMIVYRDGNHLAEAFVARLAPAMARQLVPIVATSAPLQH